MSKHSTRGTDSRRSRKPKRPFVATAAAIGGAGLVLAAPGAALMANPAEAQAQGGLSDLTSLFGNAGLSGLGGTAAGAVTGLADPFFALATAIPFLNTLVANGTPGTAAHPDGGNAGLLAGNGGNGYTFTVAVDGTAAFGAAGGNGGNAGLFIGSGGNGGNGGPGNALLNLDGGNGGNGGAGAAFGIGNGGSGGGGGGGGGLNGVNPTTTDTADRRGGRRRPPERRQRPQRHIRRCRLREWRQRRQRRRCRW